MYFYPDWQAIKSKLYFAYCKYTLTCHAFVDPNYLPNRLYSVAHQLAPPTNNRSDLLPLHSAPTSSFLQLRNSFVPGFNSTARLGRHLTSQHTLDRPLSSIPGTLILLSSTSPHRAIMEDDDGADAMAAAMGFSSFGTQPSAKRRKFNSSSDSYVAGSSSSSGGDHGKGANALPLGTRPPPPAQRPSQPALPQQQQNANEISLDDDDDDDNFEPQYIDTSRPAAPAEAAPAPAPGDAAVQATIDSIVGSAGLPGSGELQVGGGHGGHHRGGPRGDSRHRGGQPWYQDYYDPTANMNPWEKLEKQNGLEPLGNDWLSWEESKARWEKLQSDTSPQETAAVAA